jgi:chromosome segregation ATPase
MDSAVIVSIISALVASATAVLAFRSSTTANAANARKVDLEEHRDAIERLHRIIDEQDKHIERVRIQLDRVQDQLAREQDVSNALRATVRALQEQVDELMRSRARLEKLLAVHTPRSRQDPRTEQ